MMTKLMRLLLLLIIGYSVWIETKSCLITNTKKTCLTKSLNVSWKAPLEKNQKRIDLYNMDNKINYAFVTGREDTKFKGYVPRVNNKPHENSGVTIGTGFDLKEKTPEFLEKIGLEPEVIDTLTRYLGVSGAEAEALLQTAPLK